MKKCLFTIHFGGYDTPHEPFRSDGWDYVLFTNRTDLKSDIWDIRTMVSPLPNYLAARYVYINSHRFMGGYDYSLMIGGQIHNIGDLNEFVRENIDLSKDINLMRHVCRNCIYEEAEVILKEDLDKSGNVPPTMAKYKADGFPENFGLSGCGIIGRRNRHDTKMFEQEWWHQVMTGSYRDQLSFDYVRWKLGADINWFPSDVMWGDYFSLHQHDTGKKVRLI